MKRDYKQLMERIDNYIINNIDKIIVELEKAGAEITPLDEDTFFDIDNDDFLEQSSPQNFYGENDLTFKKAS